MRSIQILMSLVLLAIGAGVPARGHSWYPKECCADRDCIPADDVTADTDGHMIVLVDYHRIWIPFGLAPRPSADGRVHICFQVIAGELDNSSFVMPICLFVPPQS
jgi:hypothetical protein